MKTRTCYDLEKSFTGMRDVADVGPAGWDARQEALGIPVDVDVLEIHEIVFMERFTHELGQHFVWIAKDEKSLGSTNDFYWLEQQVAVELKSTRAITPKYRSEASKIRTAVKSSMESEKRGVGTRKDFFILDYYGTKLTRKILYQLSTFNDRNPDYAVKRLWYADKTGIHELEE